MEKRVKKKWESPRQAILYWLHLTRGPIYPPTCTSREGGIKSGSISHDQKGVTTAKLSHTQPKNAKPRQFVAGVVALTPTWNAPINRWYGAQTVSCRTAQHSRNAQST